MWLLSLGAKDRGVQANWQFMLGVADKLVREENEK